MHELINAFISKDHLECRDKSLWISSLQCSTSCGNGIQTRQDFCLSSLTHKPVNPLFCRHFPKAIVVRGCSAGPCPEQGGPQSPGAQLQPVTPATHLPTAAAAPEHRHKDLGVPLSAGPREQTKPSGGEEDTAKRSFLCAAGLWGSCCQTGTGAWEGRHLAGRENLLFQHVHVT